MISATSRELHAEVDWPSARARLWTERLAGAAAQIEAIVAIGSAARHAVREGSDVDLIVVHRGDRPRVRPPAEVDVRWINVTQLDAYVKNGDDVVAWGAKFGVPLYDPRRVWADLVDRWLDRLPRPSPERCRERADRARRYAADLLAAGDIEAAAEQVLTMLTHRARAVISAHGAFPASRQELIQQLGTAGDDVLANLLKRAVTGNLDPAEALRVVER